jgi:hypothetical protein
MIDVIGIPRREQTFPVVTRGNGRNIGLKNGDDLQVSQ